MAFTLKLEELAMLILGISLFGFLKFSWWIFAALFFAPDLGMLGYLFGNRGGAFTYNLFHHKGVAITAYLAGIYLYLPWLQLTGIVLFSHASFDRMLNYGLKYKKGFRFTHLGEIGKTRLLPGNYRNQCNEDRQNSRSPGTSEYI